MGVISSRGILDPYTTLEDLGKTPYGRAFRGLDPDGETSVVIVRIHSSGLPADEREALVAEARALTRLVQPGMPTIYEVREDDAGLHLVLAPPDPSLPEVHVHDRKGLLRHGVQLLLLLAEAHASGILHRHLGEGSVRRTADGSLTLTGFGLTRLSDDPTWEAPPEVVGGGSATLAGDVHAVGRLLQRWADQAGPSVLGGPAEDPLGAVLDRATADEPSERYEDAADMARALSLAANLPRKAGQRGSEETQQLDKPVVATPLEDPPESRSRPLRGLLLAVGLVAVVFGGVWVAGDFWGAKEGSVSEQGSQAVSEPEVEPEVEKAEEAPEGAPAKLEHARSLVEEGRVAEAVPILEEVLASGELANPVPVLDLLGTIWLQAGRPDEAVDLLSRATALQPDPDLLYKLGLAQAAAGNPAEAAEQFRAALELDPESPRIREALRHLEDN